MKNKFPIYDKKSGIGLSGAPSLLVIFGVLFLTILTILTWERARTAEAAASLTAEQTVRLYDTECMADEILAVLRLGEIPPSVTEENGVYSYICPISDTQYLKTSVTVFENGDYSVLSRHVVTLVPETDDDILPLPTE